MWAESKKRLNYVSRRKGFEGAKPVPAFPPSRVSSAHTGGRTYLRAAGKPRRPLSARVEKTYWNSRHSKDVVVPGEFVRRKAFRCWFALRLNCVLNILG